MKNNFKPGWAFMHPDGQVVWYIGEHAEYGGTFTSGHGNIFHQNKMDLSDRWPVKDIQWPDNAKVNFAEEYKAGRSVKPRTEELCEDEGCPHHGTIHVCINSTQPSKRPLFEAVMGLSTILIGLISMLYLIFRFCMWAHKVFG